MKRLFLLVLLSALLVTMGFAQTPAAGGNTDPANVIGCLGGSDGNYTVAENGTRQIFKITTSNVDLKPHVGHDVKLIGHKASGAVGSGAADNSFAVAELSMISEHCATAAATVGAVVPYSQTVLEPTTATPAPSAPASTPAVDAAAPAATVSPSAATASTPAVDTAAPAATVSPSATTVSTPAVEAVAPATAVSPSSETVSPPAAKAAQPTRPSAHPHKPSLTKAAAATAPAATVDPSSETVSTPAADAATAPNAVTPAAPVSPSSETDSTPAAAAPISAVTHRAGSLTLLISFVVLVVVLGTLAPLFGRWRKRKMLERTGTPNLSFTHEVSSDLDKPEPRKVA